MEIIFLDVVYVTLNFSIFLQNSIRLLQGRAPYKLSYYYYYYY